MAKNFRPFNRPLSTSNRFTIFLLPGTYQVRAGEFRLDTQFVDIIGLGRRINSDPDDSTADSPGGCRVVSNGTTVTKLVNNVVLGNFCIVTTVATGSTSPAYVPSPTSGFASEVFVDMTFHGGGDSSTRGMTPVATYSGFYVDCLNLGSGGFGEGASSNASGDFYNCRSGLNSFGGNGGTSSGQFFYCKGGDGSFGGGNAVGTASGLFYGCSRETSFGTSTGGMFGGLTASGNFSNCTTKASTGDAGQNGFGNGGTASGVFVNCDTGTNAGFGCSNGTAQGIATGTFVNCRAGSNSFGCSGSSASGGNNTGTFINCSAGSSSFGGFSAAGSQTCSGTYRNCVAGDTSFASRGTASGIFHNCQAGDNSFAGAAASGLGGTFSGTAFNCSAGLRSFGGSGTATLGTLSGTLHGCTTTDTPVVNVTGKIYRSSIPGWQVHAINTSDSTAITNTAVETNFDRTISVPANSWRIGQVQRFTAFFKYSADAVTPGTLILKLKAGSTALVTTGALALSAGAANLGIVFSGIVSARTIGATGTLSCNGVAEVDGGAAFVNSETVVPSNGTRTVDTTAAQTFQISATMSVADTDNTITLENFLLEPIAAF